MVSREAAAAAIWLVSDAPVHATFKCLLAPTVRDGICKVLAVAERALAIWLAGAGGEETGVAAIGALALPESWELVLPPALGSAFWGSGAAVRLDSEPSSMFSVAEKGSIVGCDDGLEGLLAALRRLSAGMRGYSTAQSAATSGVRPGLCWKPEPGDDPEAGKPKIGSERKPWRSIEC